MKKATKVSLVAALAVSALTPAMAIGAETNHAAPGFYNVDNGKVVTADAFVLLSNTEKVNLLKNTNVYYADGEGKVVQATKIIDSKTDAALVAALFPETELEADKNVTLTPEGTVVPGETAELKVESVKAINATQVEIKFNNAVDKATLFTAGGDLKTANVVLTAVDAQFPAAASTTNATLSADGKTLVVNTNNPIVKRYKVVVDNVKDKEGKEVETFNSVINFDADTVAPTIVDTEKLNATQIKVKFSEPIKPLATAGTSVTFKDIDGNTIAASGNGVTIGALQNSATEVVFTLGTDVPANKEIKATFIGVQDLVGNVMTPNPSVATFQKGNKDGVVPTVNGITQTGGKKFTIKFSEAVQKPAANDITVNGTAVTVVEAVGTDSTTYEFTTAAFLDGAMTVASANNPIVDLSGETTTFSKVVSFVKDEVAPKVTATAVAKDVNDGKEYLEITFDKDVELSSAVGTESKLSATGTYVENFITKAITAAGANNNIDYKVATNKKVVRVELDTFLGTTTDVKGALYDLDLAFANVSSTAGAAVTTGEAKFTRGEDGPGTSTDVVVVSSVVKGSDNDKVNVTFDKAVDGATATNPANYTVDGAVVESVSLAAASGTQVATLNLKKDSNSFSGNRNVTIQNVKALNSNKVMQKTIVPVNLDENIRPTVSKAELTAVSNITLTFSEAVSNANDTSGADFELIVGGSTSAKTVAAEVVATGAEKNTLVLTVSAPLTADEIAKGISIKPISTVNIKDVKGNSLNAGTITVK